MRKLPDVDYGAGRLDAYAALAAAGAPPATPAHVRSDGTLAGTGAVADVPLHVTTTAHPIAATLLITALSAGTAGSPDFQLELFNPSGVRVAQALTNRRQDELGLTPTVRGTWTLRIRSFRRSGGYLVDVSAGLAGEPPPPRLVERLGRGRSPRAGSDGPQ